MADINIGGNFGGFFNSFIDRIVGSFKVDWRKINPTELKLAVTAFCTGLNATTAHSGQAIKPALDILGGVDDTIIDKAVALEAEAIDAFMKWAHARIDEMFSGGLKARNNNGVFDKNDFIAAFWEQ